MISASLNAFLDKGFFQSSIKERRNFHPAFISILDEQMYVFCSKRIMNIDVYFDQNICHVLQLGFRSPKCLTKVLSLGQAALRKKTNKKALFCSWLFVTTLSCLCCNFRPASNTEERTLSYTCTPSKYTKQSHMLFTFHIQQKLLLLLTLPRPVELLAQQQVTLTPSYASKRQTSTADQQLSSFFEITDNTCTFYISLWLMR